MRLEFAADGSVQVRTGKVELGQGIRTALAQIAADELGLAIERVQVLAADTAFGPDEGVTSGSLSVQDGGSALRAACIEARKQPPRTVPLVGSSVPRTDLAAKFAGAPSFIHDLAPPGLLHGRVLHPPRRDAQLAGVDLARVSSLPGVVAVHRDGHCSACWPSAAATPTRRSKSCARSHAGRPAHRAPTRARRAPA